MSLNPADVLKITDKFVKEMLSYLRRRKYLLDPSPAKVNTYYADAVIVTDMLDCLSYEQLCELQSKADSYTSGEDIPDVIVTPCSDTVNITLSAQAFTCTYNTVISNPNDNTNFAYFNLSADTTNHVGTVNILTTNSCTGSVTTNVAETGCAAADTCDSDIFNFQGLNINSIYNGLALYPNGYFETIKVYETDANGIPNLSPIILNIAPSNLTAWTSCGTCAAINAAHLVFNHANFATAFKNLMDNVSKTLYGSVYLNFTVNPNYGGIVPSISIFSLLKHLPSGRWITINPKDSYLTWNDGSGNIFNSNYGIIGWRPAAIYHEETISTICGENDIVVKAASTPHIYPPINQTASQFYNLVLLSNNSTVPLTVTGDINTSCSYTILSAVYSPSNLVSSVQWLDPGSNTISTTDTVTVTESGMYTFEVTTINNCVISQTITI